MVFTGNLSSFLKGVKPIVLAINLVLLKGNHALKRSDTQKKAHH